MSEQVGVDVRFGGDSSGVVTEGKRAKETVNEYGVAIRHAEGRTKKFEKSTRDATKSMTRFAGVHQRVQQAARRTAIAIGAMTTAYIAFTRAGLQSVDALGKTSDKLGVATERLAGLRLAAEQTGVPIRQFDVALQRLVRRTAEAAAGTGEAQVAFKALGLSASELVKQEPDQILARIAEKFVDVQNQSQRVAIGFKLFDTEGVALVNTLALGASGLEEFQRKAEIAGLVISRETARGVERANDATNLLTNSFKGLSQQLAARSAPLIEAINTELFESVEALGGVSSIADKVFNALIKGAGFVADAWNGLKVVALGLRAAFQQAGLGILAIIGSLDAGFVVLGNKVIELINLITFRLNEAITKMVLKFRDFAQNFADSSSGILPDSIVERAQAVANTTNKVAEALVKTRSASRIARLEFSEFLISANRNAAELADTYTNEFLEALRQPPPSEGFEEWAARVTELSRLANEEWVRRQQELRDNAANTADDIASSMETAATRSKTAWESFGEDIRSSFVQTFGRAEGEVKDFLRRIEQSIKEAALRGAFDITIGGFFQSGAGGNLFNQGVGALGRLFGAGGGSAGGASGGLLSAAGGAALFGGGSGLTTGISNLATRIFGFDSGITNAIDDVLGGGLGRSLNNLGGTLLSGFAGQFAGNALGEALFGRQAESSLGATAGGIIGSFFGPLGTGVGSALGSLVDVAFGGDGRQRVNIGALVNQTGQGGRFGELFTGASGLTFQGFQRRAGGQGAEAAEQFAQTLLTLDNALTTLTRSLGVNVDFSGLTGLGRRADAGTGGAGNFFGLRGFNGATGSLTEQADAFVIAWLDQVNEQLPERVQRLLGGVEQTAQSLVSAFEAGIQLDQLLDLNVVRDINEAVDRLLEDQRTLTEVYSDTVENVLELAGALDGGAEGIVNLTNALTEQRTIATELAIAYRETSIAADSLLGSTITRIQESVLTEEELYNRRRQQIADLTNELTTTIDPLRIREIVSEVDRLANDAFNLLDQTQAGSLSGGFVDTLTAINDLAQQQIDAGLADLANREDAVTAAIDFELASQNIQTAADTFADAATAIGNFPSVITIEIPGIGSQVIDLDAIRDQIGEVNI